MIVGWMERMLRNKFGNSVHVNTPHTVEFLKQNHVNNILFEFLSFFLTNFLFGKHAVELEVGKSLISVNFENFENLSGTFV
jgi:hypothetical protein